MTLARMQRELSAAVARASDLVPKGGLKPVIREHVLADAGGAVCGVKNSILVDIVEAADASSGFSRALSVDAFLRDDLVRSAVLHKLTVIGEAAARLPLESRQRHAEIEWADIVAVRNIARSMRTLQ